MAAFALAVRAHRQAFPGPLRERLGRTVTIDPDAVLTDFRTPAARRALATVEILVSGWGCPRIDEDVLTAAPHLRAVVHAAGTVKALIAPAVYERGVVVSSAAQANAVPVAEFTIATMVLGAKQVFARARRYAADPARITSPAPAGAGLAGSIVGVIGASRIGRLVMRRLRDLDVRVLLADPHAGPAVAAQFGAELVTLDTLCARSDIVTLHAPALPETRGLIGERRLSLMPDGALFINTARGSLVDTAALVRHCAPGRISAVLDVTDPEPLPAGHPLLKLDNVYVTPHLAGAEGKEVYRLGEFAVAEVERLVRGEPLAGQVEREELPFIA
ncbi:hydroxyacid dehydrogenase [Kineosporia sp. J2-2]|uniref:Hydroxyacid dehydrogenase n=1 Tax=Kineosporia corallincola TaxID=2835133 RepID=A0ABS5TBT4_9ACTN|nr:hydroxyacid dehydrogenase [Kineosporia corallincola]MBT0768537.1 hydroxyacid dehydrogenase [Kineosporia corallincola]